MVVTKDRDFRDGRLLTRSPHRLLVVATGNITNAALIALFQENRAVVPAVNIGRTGFDDHYGPVS